MPNFEDVGALGTIKSYSKANAGDVLVEYGEFKGRSENQFGYLYRYKVIYEGKKTLERGAMKGKEANQVKVMQDRDYVPSGSVTTPTPAANQEQEDDILA